MKRKKHSTLSKNWDEFSATNFLPRVVREPICGGKGRFTFVRGANPSPLCWDLATTIRARQPIYTAHPILIYAQPAPPFSRKQRNFHFHFLEREILIGDLWNSTNEFSLSVLSEDSSLWGVFWSQILNRILIEMMPHLKQILILLYFLQHYGRKRAIWT